MTKNSKNPINKTSNSNSTAKPEQIKPSVGIIYSDNEYKSLESKNSAYYLAGLLATSGYSDIYLIGLEQINNNNIGKFNERLYYCTPGYTLSTPVEAPVSCITHETWSILPTCDLILCTVNSNDTTILATKLVECLAINNSSSTSSSKKIPVVSLQRGVKNSSTLKDE